MPALYQAVLLLFHFLNSSSYPVCKPPF